MSPAGPPGLPLPVSSWRNRPSQVLGQVPRVVTAPADLVGGAVTEDGAGLVALGHATRLHECLHGDRVGVDRAGEHPGGGEQVRMARRVVAGAPAAHRQPRDGAGVTRRDRVVVRVDPREELVDVERLPHRRAAGAEVPPVDVVAEAARLRHHDDERVAGRDRLCVALRGPVHVAAGAAVQEVQHRVPRVAVRVVALGKEDADLRLAHQRGRGEGQLVQPRVHVRRADVLEARLAGRRHRRLQREPGEQRSRGRHDPHQCSSRHCAPQWRVDRPRDVTDGGRRVHIEGYGRPARPTSTSVATS